MVASAWARILLSLIICLVCGSRGELKSTRTMTVLSFRLKSSIVKNFGILSPAIIKKRKRVFEEVALDIKEAIIKGLWKPGDRLPAENELANQFGVSRHTIREALRTLELSGFVIIRTGVAGGPIIENTILSRIGSLYLDAFQMKDITVEEFTAARLAIEKIVLSDAIDNADEEDIESLNKNIKEAKKKIENKEIATDANFEFHSLLARASKNQVFIILEKTINTINQELRSRSPVDFQITRGAVKDHEKMLDALINKDREKAFKLLERHLSTVGKSLKP